MSELISSVIVETLEKLGLRYPVAPDLAGLTVT